MLTCFITILTYRFILLDGSSKYHGPNNNRCRIAAFEGSLDNVVGGDSGPSIDGFITVIKITL